MGLSNFATAAAVVGRTTTATASTIRILGGGGRGLVGLRPFQTHSLTQQQKQHLQRQRTCNLAASIATRRYHFVTTTAVGSVSDGSSNNEGEVQGLNNKMNEALFWNRDEWAQQRRSFSSSSSTTTATLTTSADKQQPAPVEHPARILSLSDPNDPACAPLHLGKLPDGATLLQVGMHASDFSLDSFEAAFASSSSSSNKDGSCDPALPNVIFVSPHASSRETLATLLQRLPSIQWVHCRSAGIDFVTSPVLEHWKGGPVTNAKGQFSSTLAEYTLMACAYFAKDLPRLLKNKRAKNWEKYNVQELRGKTLGIVGYGDIGRAVAKLAAVYGMKIVALRRRPRPDPLVNVVYGNDKEHLNQLFSESDYILCSAPLTSETYRMIGKEQFDHAKPGSVFINVGRGPIVDEQALIEALKSGERLKGAALDVFDTEPLDSTSPLWELENVLLSPHNMDQTATFMHEATEFFVSENLPRFLRGETLLNPVDPSAGY